MSTALPNNPFQSRRARGYDLWLSLPPVGLIRRTEERALAELVAGTLRPTDTLLEIGPGTGRYTVEFAPRVAQVTAVEQSPDMAELLGRRMAACGTANCSVIEGDFMEAELEPQYDVVALIGVLDYVPEPGPFLGRAAELARRAMIFTTPYCGALARTFRFCNSLRGICITNYTPGQIRSYLPEFDVHILETGLRTRLWRGMTLACRAVRV
jgi:SAM-dependent methyltransferase